MKAIVHDRYGPPEVLRLEEIEGPRLGDDGVMVRVHAASVNSWDWDNLRGAPLACVAGCGLLKPKRRVLGADIAGRVEAVGTNVKRFRPGDDVTAHRSMFDYARLLGPTGIYVVFGGETARILQLLLVRAWLSLTRSRKKMVVLMYRPNQNLECWNELFESGQLRPVIDRTYPLRDTAAALRHLGEGRTLGKVVVTV